MKFLVGYDGTNSAKAALEVAGTHAEVFNAELLVIASLEGGGNQDADEVKGAENNLAFAESLLKEKGITIETHLLVRGMTPGEDIVQYAKDNEVDTIFIGVRRRSKVGKLLFGSNAHYIILKAHCPVMTVK